MRACAPYRDDRFVTSREMKATLETVRNVQKDGTPSGLSVGDELILQITNIRDEARILPRPVIVKEKAVFAGGDCVHVKVERHACDPSASTASSGCAWARVPAEPREKRKSCWRSVRGREVSPSISSPSVARALVILT